MITIFSQRLQKKICSTLANIERTKSYKSYYYFGYGANIDPDFFKRRVGRFEVVGIAHLEGYKFHFNTPCEYLGKGFGGIEVDRNSSLYGTLYKIDERALNLLDVLEWVPFKFYSRKTLMVTCSDQKINSEVYIPNYPRKNLKAPKSYQDLLIRGAEKMNFPVEYIKYIKSLDTGVDFPLDHSFNLSDPGKTRWFPAKTYRFHDILREKLCNLI